MSGSQVELDEGGVAASRIAADPAFSALDASGAPILAASGDPLRIVYLNASARAVFGSETESLGERLFFSEEPGARRLSELVESVRHGAALRLERLCFQLGAAPQTITVLCRKLTNEDGAACFVIAALGLRPAVPSPSAARPPAAPEADAPSIEANSPAATATLRERLLARHGARSPRFLWKTDADGRFVDVTQVLADVVGDVQADILGCRVEEVVARLSLDAADAGRRAGGMARLCAGRRGSVTLARGARTGYACLHAFRAGGDRFRGPGEGASGAGS